MTVNYTPDDPIAGQSRNTGTTEVQRWVDYADTITDVDTRLDALEASPAGATSLTVSDEAGTSYTVVSGDSGTLKRFTAAGAVTVTLPDALAVGTVVEIMAYGAGGVTIQGNGTSTVRNAGSLLQYETASAVVVATNEWVVTGPMA